MTNLVYEGGYLAMKIIPGIFASLLITALVGIAMFAIGGNAPFGGTISRFRISPCAGPLPESRHGCWPDSNLPDGEG